VSWCLGGREKIAAKSRRHEDFTKPDFDESSKIKDYKLQMK
jgi:hypothetical protein